MRNVLVKIVVENKTRYISDDFSPKILPLWDNVEKYCRDGQGTDDNVTRAQCILDTQGYRHTLRIRIAYVLLFTNAPQC